MDFSSVNISYIDLMDHRNHRREHLRRHYYFDCECARCAGEAPRDHERDMFKVHCPTCAASVYVGYAFDREDLKVCTK